MPGSIDVGWLFTHSGLAFVWSVASSSRTVALLGGCGLVAALADGIFPRCPRQLGVDRSGQLAFDRRTDSAGPDPPRAGHAARRGIR